MTKEEETQLRAKIDFLQNEVGVLDNIKNLQKNRILELERESKKGYYTDKIKILNVENNHHDMMKFLIETNVGDYQTIYLSKEMMVQSGIINTIKIEELINNKSWKK